MYVGLHVQYPLFYQILIKLNFFDKYSKNDPNIKFHENPSSGRRVVTRGRTDGHRHDQGNRRFVILRTRHKTETEGSGGQADYIEHKRKEEKYVAESQIRSHKKYSQNINRMIKLRRMMFLVEDIPLCLSIILKCLLMRQFMLYIII
jgi:hypothetical protein